jgi:uncharacterized protein (DUF4415 family)
MRSKGEAMKDHCDFRDAQQGPRVPPDPGKTQISIRIDNDVLDWFRDEIERAGGGSYQTNMNAALRAQMLSKSGVLEAALRKGVREVMREELRDGTSSKRAAGSKGSRPEPR